MKGFIALALIAVAAAIALWLWRVGNRSAVTAHESRSLNLAERILRLLARASAMILGLVVALFLIALLGKMLPLFNQ
jgi:hypothetical protein